MSGLLDYLCETQPDFRRARLPSLFSDFKGQKSSNPDGYHANIAAWESALTSAAGAGWLDDGILSVQMGPRLELQLSSPQYGKPQGLEIVEEECIASGRLISLTGYLNREDSFYDYRWNIKPGQLPTQVFTWMLRQTGVLKVSKDRNHRYVLLADLEKLGGKVFDKLSSITRRVDRVIPIKEFRGTLLSMLPVQQMSDTDFQIMLKYLSRDKMIIAVDTDLVKVKAPNADSVELQQEDRQICSLKTVITDIQEQIDAISHKTDALLLKAKEAVNKKNRVAAVSALKSKKAHEELLFKRTETLAQLEKIFHKIEEAADNLEVVNAMEGSATVLKTLNKELGGIDRVDAIIDDLHDEMTKVNEVSNAFTDHSEAMTSVDESEIDNELREMEAAAHTQESRKQDQSTDDLIRRLEDINIQKAQTTEEKQHDAPEAIIA